MGLTIAYLAQGRLYVKDGDAEPREIESRFVEQANERARKTEERNAWKASGGDGPDMFSGRMLWRDQGPRGIKRIQIKGVTGGEGQMILFALDTDLVGGLFEHNPADKSERRLFHKQGFRGQHLAKHPRNDSVALSVRGEMLDAHIAVTDTQGRRVREITEGDCIDESPSWAPGGGRTLVYQSAGIGRNQQGFQASVGPYRIEQLDLDGGEMKTLAEDDQYDFLSPRMGTDASLYFIRRPYSPDFRPFSYKKAVFDTVLFPFRLVRAFVHFFNFFSTAFSGKPLLTAGGPEREHPNAGVMMLWGKMIDAEKVLKAGKDGDAVSLVPATWQLVRRNSAGQDQTLAKAVLSFDLCDDGSVVYTNGTSVFRLHSDGRTDTIVRSPLIEQVTVLRTQPSQQQP